MILSRLRGKKKEKDQTAPGSAGKDKRKLPELNEYLQNRDYAGAISVLTFQKPNSDDPLVSLWLAYCGFHSGDYKFAADQYDGLMGRKGCPPQVSTYLACCHFYLGNQDEAWTIGGGAPESPLKTRVMFHLAHKRRDEKALLQYHRQLKEELEDQLCLASIHYLRSHFQEAIDIYKQELLKNRNFIALNVYLALCYYKLDYYDVSLEVLNLYLSQYPDSATAGNLKACNHFKLYNGRSAENELRVFEEQATPTLQFARDLISHNLVVFRGGERALQILPPLVDILPEARLNLIIYYLKQNNPADLDSAFALVDEIEPSTPNEFILKAIVYSLVGQPNMWKDHIKTAQEFFQTIGNSPSECDTLPGRQCMASAYFLSRQFDEVLVYLNSIKSYFYTDNSFNFNFGQALAQVGNFGEAEDVLLLVNDDNLLNHYTYISTLARCHIMNRKARLAWELYLRLNSEQSDAFSLLQIIANDCYRMGAFFYAAKAFDVLERLDANPEYWEGKRGACIGAFQLVIAGREPADTLREVLSMLSSSRHPQVDHIIRVMRKWAQDHKIYID